MEEKEMKRTLVFLFTLALLAVPAFVFANGSWARGSVPAAPSPATADVPIDYTWKIDGANANVSVIGTDNHVLNLSNIGIEAGALRRVDTAVLSFKFRVAHNSTRRILAWTDLSGNTGETADISFATTANLNAGKIALSDALGSGTNAASIKIPKTLLSDDATGRVATEIYILFTVDAGADGATNRYTQAGENRGGTARNGVNGINLAREFDIFDTVKLSVEIDPTIFVWRSFPAEANVRIMGTDDHVLKLSGIGIDPGILRGSKGGTLNFNFRVAHNSTRRILAWTDLSGNAGEVADISFATTANLTAGKIALTDALGSGTNTASITFPKALLSDDATGKVATEIYVIFAVDAGPDGGANRYTQAGENRGGTARNGVNGINLAKEFEIFSTVKLTVNYVTFATHISLTPGTDAAKMNFSWLTEKGTAKNAIVQLARKADVANDVMPRNASQFTGITSAGTSVYDVNRVTVTGLAPNTEYAYRVGDGAEWSAIYNFKTGDPRGAYNVIVVGDPQLLNAREGEAWKKTLERATAKAGNPSFLLSAGDQADKSNSMEQYDYIMAPKILRGLPVAAVIGNHDTFDFLGGTTEQIALMPLHYNWPNHYELTVDKGDDLYVRAGGNYYFSYGNTLYISLNSNVKDIEAHREFMEKATASHPDAVWRIAIFHHDIFGTGDHAGTAYQDAQKMQPTWSPFLDEFGIDLAINGHDHVYGRSMFIKGNRIQSAQMPANLDPLGTNIVKPNPGVYVLPQGIQYMALSGSATEKMYAPETQEWVAYTPGFIGVPEYSVMTIDGTTLTFITYRSDTDAVTDSITLRKTATRADLEKLIPDCEAVKLTVNITGGWDAFQNAIAAAKTALSGSPANIHAAYVALYNAYYAITVNTNKTALRTLIDDVKNVLASASEGVWEGQYPAGSKAALRAVLDKESLTYIDRLSTQVAADASVATLTAAFNSFKGSVSHIPIPWVDVHNISALGVNQVELVGWKKGDMYFAYLTKQEFAKDNLGGKRSDPSDGPANGLGGRGPSESYITRTHIGEWIRYDLNVERSGMYRAALGAANGSGRDQTILLRDADYNILCTFVVPANAVLPVDGWRNAPMVAANRDFYLPAGSYYVELFFINDGVGVNVPSGSNVAYPNDAGNRLYPDGADVDILTLQRVGDGTPPVVQADPSIFVLPLPPTSIQGAPARQKGWASEGYVDDQGNVSTGISLETFMAATTLVLEVAARPASTNIQLHLIPEGDSTTWAANETTPNNTPALVMDTLYRDGKLVFPLNEMLGYEAWSKSQEKCMIDISYYSYAWDDMNVMKAYLILDLSRLR
jgi:hypothetical protein